MCFIKVTPVLILLMIGTSIGFQTELSVIIDPGKRECFHQHFTSDLNIEFDYQVLYGGELDVSFWISSPSNRVIFTELRKQGGQAQFKSEENGEYRFCFDNSYSRFQSKHVFFYISTNDHFEDPYFTHLEEKIQTLKDKLGLELDGKIDNIQESFNKVSKNLEKAQRVQNAFRGYELIDRNLMEESYERVNFWSFFNIFIMVLVGIIQVFMIKSLFEESSKIGKVLRGNN
jgi:protein ERP2